MEVKTSELIDEALDWTVAKCSGRNPKLMEIVRYPGTKRQEHVSWSVRCDPPERDEFGEVAFQPSTNWAQGGPIIEQMHFLLETVEQGKDYWCSGPSTAQEWHDHPVGAHGPTPLIAAMRCLVASKLGDVVDVPDELMA